MPKTITISLDAMGGDNAPDIVIDGAAIAHDEAPELKFIIYGDEKQVLPLLDKYPSLKSDVEFIHTDQWISMDAKPSQALRHGRQSSMRLAINAVANGEANCVVSSGNTGALMMMARFSLKMLSGIDRPAISGFFPTLNGSCVMLDLGANVTCDSDNLLQFGTMGAIFAKAALGKDNPSIGILNIGEEELKGNEVVKTAAASMRRVRLPGDFYGFIEGDDIAKGTVDVVVSDGFTGNVALKTAEGMAHLYSEAMKEAFSSSFMSKLGYFFARRDIKKVLSAKMDPRIYNGAMFLGLQGVCVKSHGGTDEVGFAHAIKVGADLVRNKINERISDEIERISGLISMEENDANDEEEAEVSAPTERKGKGGGDADVRMPSADESTHHSDDVVEEKDDIGAEKPDIDGEESEK